LILNFSGNSISTLQEQNTTNDVPIPTFIAHNHMAVTETQGTMIPPKVLLFPLEHLFSFAGCLFMLPFIILYLRWGSYLSMFRCHLGPVIINVKALLAILLVYRLKQIQLMEMVWA
jgi:hypothetical protein